MADKVRLASIGLGWWGGMLAEKALESGEAEIVTGFARTESTRNEFAEKFGCRTAGSLDELLGDDEVEGVLVATPHSTHLDIIEQAAGAGKHVFVEKPLTLSVSEARQAVDAAAKAGVTLQVGHHRRRQPATRQLRRLIDDGALGQISLLEANLSLKSGLNPKEGWRSDPNESPLGGMTGLGVHMADNLIYLGGPAQRVTVLSKQTLARSPLDDVTVIAVELASGALGYLGTSTVVPKVCTTAVYGSEGSAWSEEEGEKLFRQGIDDANRDEVDIDGPDALADQLGAFARSTRSGDRPEVDGEQGLEVVALLEAAIHSHERGQVVEVDELRG